MDDKKVEDKPVTKAKPKAKKIAEKFDKVTQRTVERWIKQLKDEGKIECRGSKKTGGYYVKF